jgi:DNA-binding Lrp family transcriptional regulator
MSPGTPPEGSTVAGRLDDRVLEVLQELPGRIAFSGLRRSLGAHPESLTRALKRLEREGLVERTPSGYRAVVAPGEKPSRPLSGLRSVAQVEIPAGVDGEAILQRLSGRWFGSLRWMGVVERSHDRLLAWAHRDGTGTVLLGLQRGQVRIFTTTPLAVEPESDADDAAYEVLVALADALRPEMAGRAPGNERSTRTAMMILRSVGARSTALPAVGNN